MEEQARSVVEQMREDWNSRASEDAHYYVAFGRKDQDDDEFQATASEVIHGLEWEMRRLPAGRNRRAYRAVEIGCGPGRLMKPMSAHFGEIHGVDISDQMVARARRRLSGIPHAHAHVALNSNLEMFADESFDFAYSYAVFQHIPSRDVVLGYIREIWRVLKPGAYARVQLNGLPETAARYDTWSGVRISAQEFEAYCRENDLQILSLEGVQTQYMWTTLRKRERGWYQSVQKPSGQVQVRRITNAQNSEPVAPVTGRFAALSLWLDSLPEECDLLNLEIVVGRSPGRITYIGPREHDGLTQVNLRLPPDVETGLQPVRILWRGEPIGPPSKVRIVPQPALVPRVVNLADGINILAGTRIETRSIKATLEEVMRPEEFHATVDGVPVCDIDYFCTDPVPPRYEVNFRLPDEITPGPHLLEVRLGRKVIAPYSIEVVA